MGEQSVKNIARPVRVYALRPEGVPGMPTASASSVSSSSPPVAPRLSIVVLPFTNLSDDREQQYFADGITEDLTTDLSRLAKILVISRSTAFTYKDRRVDARQIGRELCVRYVLEGSVRRSGNQLRVSAQLIDAETDTHLWAERFNGDTIDLFALQDEITRRIAVALELELVAREAARAPEHPDPLDCIFRGRAAVSNPRSRGTGTRRLAAILAADVVGYSRLMSADEEGTHERFKAHLVEPVDPKIREHYGRIVKTTGDGVLAEFACVVDAVRCAGEIQRAMVDRDPDLAEEQRLRFRIGVNLGDVIADGGGPADRASRCTGLHSPGTSRRGESAEPWQICRDHWLIRARVGIRPAVRRGAEVVGKRAHGSRARRHDQLGRNRHRTCGKGWPRKPWRHRPAAHSRITPKAKCCARSADTRRPFPNTRR
jgi:TolB-like protein